MRTNFKHPLWVLLKVDLSKWYFIHSDRVWSENSVSSRDIQNQTVNLDQVAGESRLILRFDGDGTRGFTDTIMLISPAYPQIRRGDSCPTPCLVSLLKGVVLAELEHMKVSRGKGRAKSVLHYPVSVQYPMAIWLSWRSSRTIARLRHQEGIPWQWFGPEIRW